MDSHRNIVDEPRLAEARGDEQARWKQRWNPFGMCSWPPEDDRIESFHRHVRDQAKAIIGADLARMTIDLMFNAIADHLPDLTSVADPVRLRSCFINGIKHWQVDYQGGCPAAH